MSSRKEGVESEEKEGWRQSPEEYPSVPDNKAIGKKMPCRPVGWC